MMRTKWMRLGVRDPADILRWAAAQDTRGLDDFRYRVIRGRAFVSFRLVPRYRVEIGTSDIVVVAHVTPTPWRRLVAGGLFVWHKATRQLAAAIAGRARQAPAPSPTAALYSFAPPRASRR